MEKLQEEEGGENDLTMLFQEEMKRCETPGVTVAPAVSATSRNPSKSLEIRGGPNRMSLSFLHWAR